MSSQGVYLKFAEYMDELMRQTYGEENLTKILEVLNTVPQGHCGVEVYYSTFPKLLAARGVLPLFSYETIMKSKPLEDGNGAATPEQRREILYSLKKMGFETEVANNKENFR